MVLSGVGELDAHALKTRAVRRLSTSFDLDDAVIEVFDLIPLPPRQPERKCS